MLRTAHAPETVAAEFLRVEGELRDLMTDMADAVSQDVHLRTVEAFNAFDKRGNVILRNVTDLSHLASHAIARIQRDNATAEGFSPQQDRRIADLQEMQHKANHWRSRFSAIMTCGKRQMVGPSVPLYEPETDAYDSNQPIFDALEDTILKLDFMVNSNRQDSEALARGAFPDIRLPPQQFAAHGHAAYRVALALGLRKTARFLDVGCGGGVKVVMASHFFPTCHGLEFDPGYARAAEVVIEGAEVPNGKVIEADALAFEGYADYDVVYFFQPMQTKEGLYALEQQIIDHVRPQTILIAPYLPFRSRFQELGCAHIAGCVYLSATTEAEGNSIRDNAERTGLKVSPDVEAVPWGNVWRPALKAFAANGFVP